MLFGWQMELLNGERLATFEYNSQADPAQPPAPRPSPDAALPFASDAKLTLPGGAAIDWSPFWFGCIPFAAAYAITGCFFFQAVSNGDPPGFVWCAGGRGARGRPAAAAAYAKLRTNLRR